MGPEILFVSVIVAAIGALSASRQGGRDILVTWRRGQAAFVAGRHDEAEECFRSTLRIAEQRFGPDHWRTALHVNALAQALLAQRRLDDAAPLVDRAIGHRRSLVADASRGDRHRARRSGCRSRARADGTCVRWRSSSAHDALPAETPPCGALVERTLARVEASAGHEAEAADALARIPFERLEPSDVRSLASFGVARIRQGDAERAVRCFTSAHALVERESPGEFAEAFYLGCWERRSRAAVATRRRSAPWSRRSSTTTPSSASATPPRPRPLVELAEVRLRLGDAAGARLACERVLALRGQQDTVAGRTVPDERRNRRSARARARPGAVPARPREEAGPAEQAGADCYRVADGNGAVGQARAQRAPSRRTSQRSYGDAASDERPRPRREPRRHAAPRARGLRGALPLHLPRPAVQLGAPVRRLRRRAPARRLAGR